MCSLRRLCCCQKSDESRAPSDVSEVRLLLVVSCLALAWTLQWSAPPRPPPRAAHAVGVV